MLYSCYWIVALEHYKFNYDIIKILPYGALPDIELMKSTINVAKIYACLGDNVPEDKEDCYSNALKYYDQAKKLPKILLRQQAQIYWGIFMMPECVFFIIYKTFKAHMSLEKNPLKSGRNFPIKKISNGTKKN